MSRIMVVDDEVVIADTMSAILSFSGYEARAFYDAESALAACADWSPEFVISDVVMPRMGGVDMAMEIKQRYPSCRILLISGQAGSCDLVEAARAQGYTFDFLMKPVHPIELLATLARLSGWPPQPEGTVAAGGATQRA